MTTTARLRLHVVDKRTVADDVVQLELADPSGAELPAWQAGAHVGLSLTAELVRQYSLCGEVADRSRYRIAVLREPHGRGGSQYVHDQLAVGDLVEVATPRNNFDFHSAERHLFLAGGIGITPLVEMMAEADRQGSDWMLAYGGRSGGSMAYVQQLTSTFGDRVHVYEQDVHGVLPIAHLLDDLKSGTLVYCCGPEGLLGAVEQKCAELGVPDLHVERFTAVDVADHGADQPFDVVLAQSGLTLSVATGQTILEAVEEAGIPVDSSCREGTCATCETFVVEGICDHRDSLLSEEERQSNKTMMICVSRARGDRIVLDL